MRTYVCLRTYGMIENKFKILLRYGARKLYNGKVPVPYRIVPYHIVPYRTVPIIITSTKEFKMLSNNRTALNNLDNTVLSLRREREELSRENKVIISLQFYLPVPVPYVTVLLFFLEKKRFLSESSLSLPVVPNEVHQKLMYVRRFRYVDKDQYYEKVPYHM